MIGKIYQRLLHTTRTSLSTNFTSLLSTLRKKTGYTFSNCKKALELHNNDITKAEEWLHSQAKLQGWTKIDKLNVHPVNDGLIGLMHSDNIAAMVELNCESDLAVKNINFQKLLSLVTLSTLNYATGKALMGHEFHKIILAQRDLGTVKTLHEDHNLGDMVACHVDILGENISLRRAVCWSVRDGMLISGYVHPPYVFDTGVMMGKFGGLICYKKLPESPLTSDTALGEAAFYLAKQVVGNNPESIGNKDKDKPGDDPDQETKLIFQRTINDPNITVGEYLNKNGLEIVDYIRFQCGEVI